MEIANSFKPKWIAEKVSSDRSPDLKKINKKLKCVEKNVEAFHFNIFKKERTTLIFLGQNDFILKFWFTFYRKRLNRIEWIKQHCQKYENV